MFTMDGHLLNVELQRLNAVLQQRYEQMSELLTADPVLG